MIITHIMGTPIERATAFVMRNKVKSRFEYTIFFVSARNFKQEKDVRDIDRSMDRDPSNSSVLKD